MWALVIALFLISLAVVIVMYFRPLYYLDIGLLDLEAASGKSADLIRQDYDRIINYFCFWNRGPLVFSTFAMSEHGRIHFADCKRIFDAVQILCIASGAMTAVSWFRHRHSFSFRYLKMAGILTVALPAVLGGLAWWRWDQFFVAFHSVLFRNDYWLFDPSTDPVILVLPDAFFFQCAVAVFVLILAGGILCLVLAHHRERHCSRKRR